MKRIRHIICAFLLLPVALLYLILMPPRARKLVYADLAQWTRQHRLKSNKLWAISFLLANYPEFRTVFYKRIGIMMILTNWWLRGRKALYITNKKIGGGLLIQHGFATIISAESIGENCKIYQQVTVGYSHDRKAPIIGNNVEICCGAKVIGGINIGDNVLIGANAVVVKDVPANSVVAGVPAKVIKSLDQWRDVAR